MKEFYFDIKSRIDAENGGWSWPPVWSGKIEAEDKKEARKLIEEEYQQKFTMRDGKNVKDVMFLLSIKPMSDYLAKRFHPISCPICATEFTANEVYILGMSDARFCSINCKRENELSLQIDSSRDLYFADYQNPPVIYCIRNIKENKYYIGKSIRSFTLRWWEHIKSAKLRDKGLNKFHQVLRDTSIVDWEFKVIEVIDVYPDHITSYTDKERYILSRETHWMTVYNSVELGYNSLESLKKKERVL